MKFTDGSRSLEFEIAGYGFPETAEEVYDRNWLDVKVRWTDGGKTTECVDQCVLTWELDDLRRAIVSFVEDGTQTFDSDGEFILLENAVRFKAVRQDTGNVAIRVSFYPEGKMGEDVKLASVDLEMDDDGLLLLARTLEGAAEAYPIRA